MVAGQIGDADSDGTAACRIATSAATRHQFGANEGCGSQTVSKESYIGNTFFHGGRFLRSGQAQASATGWTETSTTNSFRHAIAPASRRRDSVHRTARIAVRRTALWTDSAMSTLADWEQRPCLVSSLIRALSQDTTRAGTSAAERQRTAGMIEGSGEQESGWTRNFRADDTMVSRSAGNRSVDAGRRSFRRYAVRPS